MAKPNPKPTSKMSNVHYLNVDITKAYREDLIKWLEGNPDVWDMIEKLCDSGLKLGFSFDAYNECMQASLTKLPENRDAGITLVLVGRGGNLIQAVQALLFKYFVVLQGEMEDLDRKNARGVTDWM